MAHHTRRTVALAVAAAFGALLGCEGRGPIGTDLGRPHPVSGYSFWTYSAIRDESGAELQCNVLAQEELVGRPLEQRWEGEVPFRVVRSHTTSNRTTLYDTLLSPQPVVVERLAGREVRIVLGGILADTLIGVEDTYYWEINGSWTCEPTLPMGAFHGSRTISGVFRAAPRIQF